MFDGVSFKSEWDFMITRYCEICSVLTNDESHANANELFDSIAVKLFVKIDFIVKLQRHQMHQESDKLLLRYKVSLIAFTNNLIDDVLDDGSLWCEQEFIVNFRSPHLCFFFYEVAKLFNFLFIKNYKQEIFMSCYGGEKEVVVREINQIST